MEMKLTLGGKERTLLFGKLGFYSYIQKATNEDPLEWFNKITEKKGIIDNIKDIAVIVFAGLNCEADLRDSENFSFEKIQKWVNALEVADISAIVNNAFGSFKVDAEEKKIPVDALPGTN